MAESELKVKQAEVQSAQAAALDRAEHDRVEREMREREYLDRIDALENQKAEVATERTGKGTEPTSVMGSGGAVSSRSSFRMAGATGYPVPAQVVASKVQASGEEGFSASSSSVSTTNRTNQVVSLTHYGHFQTKVCGKE